MRAERPTLIEALDVLRSRVAALAADVGRVNKHRRALTRARLRMVALEQAIKWLRGRIAYLERGGGPSEARHAIIRADLLTALTEANRAWADLRKLAAAVVDKMGPDDYAAVRSDGWARLAKGLEDLAAYLERGGGP